MGVQFSVRCNYWERGLITVPPELADLVTLDSEIDELIIPYELDQETQDRFYEWWNSACSHTEMHACPIGHLNNSGFRQFLKSLEQGYSVIAPEIRANVPFFDGQHGDMPMTRPSVAIELLRGINAAIKNREANPPTPPPKKPWWRP